MYAVAVNNVAELRHRVDEDSYEIIRNTPGFAEGVRPLLMRRAKRCMETQGKNWTFLYNLISNRHL